MIPPLEQHPIPVRSMPIPTRILVINDTPEIIARFQDLLVEEGYQVVACNWYPGSG